MHPPGLSIFALGVVSTRDGSSSSCCWEEEGGRGSQGQQLVGHQSQHSGFVAVVVVAAAVAPRRDPGPGAEDRRRDWQAQELAVEGVVVVVVVVGEGNIRSKAGGKGTQAAEGEFGSEVVAEAGVEFGAVQSCRRFRTGWP